MHGEVSEINQETRTLTGQKFGFFTCRKSIVGQNFLHISFICMEFRPRKCLVSLAGQCHVEKS